jgi:hypothetical protein
MKPVSIHVIYRDSRAPDFATAIYLEALSEPDSAQYRIWCVWRYEPDFHLGPRIIGQCVRRKLEEFNTFDRAFVEAEEAYVKSVLDAFWTA